jgi:hypothetical protein
MVKSSTSGSKCSARRAQGWPDLFGRTADGSRGKYSVEAIGDIDSKEA